MLIVQGSEADLRRVERLMAILANCGQAGEEAIDASLSSWEELARPKKRRKAA